ncbi:hypothetical protein Leryth_006097 [Lithospermum erythrorhizon]|nr:hypothetical protein Leryth_006097 [Lithospermum erythrorhizon]
MFDTVLWNLTNITFDVTLTWPVVCNRWLKSLHPNRKRVGKWTSEEDRLLKVAVAIFGPKNWSKIAEFVPGRMQSQCRERWANSLDPSLNYGSWTSEEDLLLKEATQEHGYCWSKVALCVPHRTDNQCMRRWTSLFPEQVPMLQAAHKTKRTAMISNFVERVSERPAIGPNDFLQVPVDGDDLKLTRDSAGRNTKRKSKSNIKKDLLIPKCENPDNLVSSDSISAITPKQCKFRRAKIKDEPSSPENREAREDMEMLLATFLGRSRAVNKLSQSVEIVSASAEVDSPAQVNENASAAGVSRSKRPKRLSAMEETSSDTMEVEEGGDDLPNVRLCEKLEDTIAKAEEDSDDLTLSQVCKTSKKRKGDSTVKI